MTEKSYPRLENGVILYGPPRAQPTRTAASERSDPPQPREPKTRVAKKKASRKR